MVGGLTARRVAASVSLQETGSRDATTSSACAAGGRWAARAGSPVRAHRRGTRRLTRTGARCRPGACGASTTDHQETAQLPEAMEAAISLTSEPRVVSPLMRTIGDGDDVGGGAITGEGRVGQRREGTPARLALVGREPRDHGHPRIWVRHVDSADGTSPPFPTALLGRARPTLRAMPEPARPLPCGGIRVTSIGQGAVARARETSRTAHPVNERRHIL